MKKINPKDLEVNPKNIEDKTLHSLTGNTKVCSNENYGCVTPTLAIDCDDETNQETVCICRTDKCVNTIDGCADTVSRGELCCPASNKPECNYSLRCESKEYCPLTEQDNCNSDGIQCINPQTDACQLHTEDACGENTFNCDPMTGEECLNTEQGCEQLSDDPGECQIISADCVD